MDYTIADKLIEQRKKHGYSQEELADKLEISRQAVSKWERAETAPDTENLIALSKLYGITIDEILGIDQRQPDSKKEAESDFYSDESYIRISKRHQLLVKFAVGLVVSILSLVFLGAGLGIFFGLAVPETRDLRLSQDESLPVRSVTVVDIERSNLAVNDESMYCVVFSLDGKRIKTNPIYSMAEAQAKVGDTIEVRVDGNGNAVMLNYKRSGYSVMGFVFFGVFGVFGILLLTGGIVLLRLAQIQKRKDRKTNDKL